MNSVDKVKMSQAVPYVLPFGVFAVLTYGGAWFGIPLWFVYPVKTLLVGGCLIWFWRVYGEEIRIEMDWLAVGVGVAIFLVWIGFEGYYPQIGAGGGEGGYPDGAYGSLIFLFFRVFGAALVVPVMEEVFWRSFALRFLVNSEFLKVPLGYFTWFSFVAVTVAFGLEHHRWLPGIVAGAAYAGVLYRSRNLFSPVLAHGVTNLLLAGYVVVTGRWEYW